MVHDVKNISGQLSMLLANAERHAANPDFQRDMLVTVRAAVSRITAMLEKLQRTRAEAAAPSLILPGARLRATLAARKHRAGHQQTDGLDLDGPNANVAMDADAFDAVITHLLNNAEEAAGPGGLVTLSLRHEPLSMIIDITDTGPGMTPEFIRDALFAPLRSTKRDGHGIGAFQARELLREAGGDLLAISRLGAGTTMRLILPLAGVRLTGTETAP